MRRSGFEDGLPYGDRHYSLVPHGPAAIISQQSAGRFTCTSVRLEIFFDTRKRNRLREGIDCFL